MKINAVILLLACSLLFGAALGCIFARTGLELSFSNPR